MPIKRRRARSNDIIGMSDPAALRGTPAAAHIRMLQENIQRLQGAIEDLRKPKPVMVQPVMARTPTIPRFVAGVGIEVLQTKDAVCIGALRPREAFVYKVTAVDTGSEDCDIQLCDANGAVISDTEIVDVSYISEPAVDDYVLLDRYGDGQLVVFAGGAAGLPVHDPTPDVTVGTTAETEAAQTDDWDVGDGTLKVTQQTRTAYSDTGGQILYAYYRDFYYAADGRLTRVSGETRVTIDTPGACP